jgi:hypothetical protein
MLGKMSPSLLEAKTNFIQGNDTNVEELLKLSTVENKPKSLMIFTHSDGKTVVSGKGFFGNYWLNATGAVDVAEDDINIKAAVDMGRVMAEFYTKYYGYDLSQEEINMILNPSDLSSEGYKE